MNGRIGDDLPTTTITRIQTGPEILPQLPYSYFILEKDYIPIYSSPGRKGLRKSISARFCLRFLH